MEAVLQPIVHQSPKHALFNTTHPARCLILHARVSSFDLSSKIKVERGGAGKGVIGVDVSIGGGGREAGSVRVYNLCLGTNWKSSKRLGHFLQEIPKDVTP